MGRTAVFAAVLILAGCERPARDVALSTPADTSDSTPASELRVVLQQLVSGAVRPADTTAAQSWFSESTAGVLRSVEVDSTGRAIVDFYDLRDFIPNASTSAGSTMLLEELNAAVFQVPGVQSVEYRMDGSCSEFWEWLQYGCQTVMRP